MHHQIPELDAKGLRGFGFKMGAVIAVLFGLLLPWLFGFGYPLWPWILGGVLVLWGLAAPSSMGGLYRGWMRVGLAVGVFNSKVILGLFFFVILMPAGLIMRLLGKDPMLRDLRAQGTSSYRVPSKTPAREHLEKPY